MRGGAKGGDMGSYYTRISEQSQIDALKEVKPTEGLQFFYSLFFTGKAAERKYLMQRRLSVLFVRGGIINAGNIECIDHREFKRLPYDEFVKRVSA